jgi:hypothetical protein
MEKGLAQLLKGRVGFGVSSKENPAIAAEEAAEQQLRQAQSAIRSMHATPPAGPAAIPGDSLPNERQPGKRKVGSPDEVDLGGHGTRGPAVVGSKTPNKRKT